MRRRISIVYLYNLFVLLLVSISLSGSLNYTLGGKAYHLRYITMMHIISPLSILNHEPTFFANLNFDTVPSFSIICFRLYFVTLFVFACMSFPRLFTLFYTLTPLSLLIPNLVPDLWHICAGYFYQLFYVLFWSLPRLAFTYCPALLTCL